MTTISTSERTAGPDAERALGIVDCDVHPTMPNGLHTLRPYIGESWARRLFGPAADQSWGTEAHASQFQLPTNRTYINPVGGVRRDARLESGAMPGSDPQVVVKELFEHYGITRGILMGNDVLGLGALVDPDAAAVIASAYNDWLQETWVAADSRFRHAIVVTAQEPNKAAAEIERMADKPGVAAIFMPLTNRLMGERHYYPIYEAAAKHGLPVCIHPNAVDGSATTAPQLAGGTPTYYTEWHAGLTQIAQANVISLVCHGVFETYKDLKVVAAESGIAWLMDVMWRLDKNWKGLRDEIPWVKRLPSEYIVEHVRLTSQPFIEPESREHLLMTLEAVHADRTLLFSSDYPHWDFDNPLRALSAVPDELRRRIQWENAQETYGGRL
jgi:predicted TIM-barrel fold metal-dependent hydrolase